MKRVIRKRPGRFLSGREEGIALVTAMIILLALTLMGIMMINAMKLETGVSAAQKDETQALLLAEAGVTQVREWFQFPERFLPTAAQITGGITTPAHAGTWLDCTNLSNSQALLAPDMTGCTQAQTLTPATSQRFFRRRFVFNGKWEYISGNSLSQFADVNGDGNQDSSNRVDKGGTDMPALSITNQQFLNSLFGLNSGKDLSSIGRITRLEIYHPMGAGLSGAAKPRAICTVRVTAETNSGFIKSIEAEIWESIFVPITAGAEAGSAASWNGNGKVHWGNILGEQDIGLNTTNIPKRCDGANEPAYDNTYDPWFNAKIGGAVTATNGNPSANTCPGTPDCIGCDGIANGVSNRPWQEYAVYQNQTVELDKWDHADAKSYALDYGQYYKVDPDGVHIYQSDANGNVLGPKYTVETFLTQTDPYRLRPDSLYIDATAAPGGTMNISLAGNFYSKGDIFIEGSVNFTGSGTGHTVNDAVMPDDSIATLNDINFEGIFYATGDMRGGGSPKFWGGVIAENGLQMSGTPEVWYDTELMTGKKNKPRTGKGKWREIKY